MTKPLPPVEIRRQLFVGRPLAGWEWLLLLFCLLLFGAQASLASLRKSAAFDEEYHLAAGYAYLKTADFRMSLSHPPLINALAAMPLLAQEEITLPLDHPAWVAADYFAFSDQFMWWAGNDPQTMLVLARLPIIGLGMLLAMGLFFWSRLMIGSVAGWVVLLLATFDPNLLANSRLVTTDLGLTCLLLLTMWRVWHWLEAPTYGNLLLAAILAGFTTASKFTGVLLWPMILLVLLLYPNWRWRRLSQFGMLAAVAYFSLWIVYRFDVGLVPSFALPFPIPAPFYPHSLWDTFLVIEEQPKPAFLFGQISQQGWWYYFPVALGVKTPLPTLILASAGCWLAVRRVGLRRSSVVWVPVLLFLGMAMTGRITIGYRHVLPVLPFLLMLAGYGVHGWETAVSRWRFLFFGVLVGWVAFRTLSLFPHQEAYFNELVGGPANGDKVLVDSNIDWGQDLILLREKMVELGIEQVNLGYFGTAPPELYEVAYWPIPGFIRHTAGAEIDAFNPYTPPPGWYAISATSLRLGLLLQNQDMYAHFRERAPVARVGYSIYLYEVEPEANVSIQKTAVVGQSVSDIPLDNFQLADGEQLVVKWTTRDEIEIIAPDHNLTLPASFLPAGQSFDFGLQLWGAAVEPKPLLAGDTLTLTLYWQVESADFPNPAPASGEPLRAFVHLSSAEDPAQIIAQYDGWETALVGLETGDTIVHPIVLQLPNEIAATDYRLRLGLYNPQSGVRWLIEDGGKTVDFVQLEPLLSP